MLFFFIFFFFNDTPTTEIYTLSLHDALPICAACSRWGLGPQGAGGGGHRRGDPGPRVAGDRKSTRLNSSHVSISYAVFCLKKKKPSNKNSVTFAILNECRTNRKALEVSTNFV